jgi:hypothetical protein
VRSLRIQSALAKNYLDEDCKRAMRKRRDFSRRQQFVMSIGADFFSSAILSFSTV